jgi:hypothetical protein
MPRFHAKTGDKIDSVSARSFYAKFLVAMKAQRLWDEQYAYSLFTCITGDVGERWALEVLRPMGDLTPAELEKLFTERFADEVRPRAAEARDTLYDYNVVQKGNQTVCEYLGAFKDVIVHIPGLDNQDQVRWFHKGLKEPLRTRSACDAKGREFANLKEIAEFALGEERRLRIMGANKVTIDLTDGEVDMVDLTEPAKGHKRKQPSAN